jgi:hypothetical protein
MAMTTVLVAGVGRVEMWRGVVRLRIISNYVCVYFGFISFDLWSVGLRFFDVLAAGLGVSELFGSGLLGFDSSCRASRSCLASEALRTFGVIWDRTQASRSAGQ